MTYGDYQCVNGSSSSWVIDSGGETIRVIANSSRMKYINGSSVGREAVKPSASFTSGSSIGTISIENPGSGTYAYTVTVVFGANPNSSNRNWEITVSNSGASFTFSGYQSAKAKSGTIILNAGSQSWAFVGLFASNTAVSALPSTFDSLTRDSGSNTYTVNWTTSIQVNNYAGGTSYVVEGNNYYVRVSQVVNAWNPVNRIYGPFVLTEGSKTENISGIPIGGGGISPVG